MSTFVKGIVTICKITINIILSIVPNIKAGEFLRIQIMHLSSQNHPVAFYLTIQSQALTLTYVVVCPLKTWLS